MTKSAMLDESAGPQRDVRLIRVKRHWAKRVARELAALILILLRCSNGIVLLDTAPGHRFLADRIARLETKSGLKIQIGRIEGSCLERRISGTCGFPTGKVNF